MSVPSDLVQGPLDLLLLKILVVHAANWEWLSGAIASLAGMET